MKTSIPIPCDSLTNAAARHSSRWFAGLLATGAILGSGSVQAATWKAAATTPDWNTVGNWSGTTGGSGIVIVNSIPTNVATISADITPIPTNISVGYSAPGRVNHVAGNASVSAGNDLMLGYNTGGIGTYNLANTAALGGILTGFGQGSGNLTIPDQVWVGGFLGAATGTLNIHTTGTIAVGTQLLVGNLGGTGTVKMDSGTLTVVNEIEVGNGAGSTGTGSTGTFSMSGGTVTKSGASTAVTIGGGVSVDGGTGTANLNGGTLTTAGVFRIGQDLITGSLHSSNGTLNLGGTNLTVNGEFWVGNNTGATGTMNFTGGSLTANSWSIVGRKDDANTGVGAVGSVTMTNGTWTKSGESNFIVGDTGAGTMNMSGGLVVVTPHTTADRGITWIANRNSCTGTLTISGTAEFRSPRFVLGVQAATNGTLNLNGGTVKTFGITGGAGTSTVNFNGSQIIASGSSSNFLGTLNNANINAGGLLVNTAGFNLTAPQALAGTGGVIKTGAGTLTLTGANTYTGNHAVNAGKLAVATQSTGIGDFIVANGATMGVVQTADLTLTLANVTLGSTGASSLDIDLGNYAGNPIAATLNITGVLTLNGPVTVNIADLQSAPGSFPLISYVSPKIGSGSFVLGHLPEGVSATLTDNGSGLVTLDVTNISFPKWTGAVDGVWDTTTQNWSDLLTLLPSLYADPVPVVFDDSAAANTAITLNIPVAPDSVTFNNSTAIYSLAGAGNITGAGGLTKTGSAGLTLSTANTYTGVTTLSGGITSVNSLANGGSASCIGASSPAASNLVFNGGTLNYTGPAVTSDRGFTINATGSAIATASDLTLGGQIASPNGNFIKSGAGNLTLSYNGANVFGTVSQGIQVQGGTLTLSGAGAQSNTVAGELWVADLPDVPADLVLNNTSLTTSSWLAIGRGNGDTGVCNVTATNSTIQTVNFSAGFNNGLANNASKTHVTLNNTNWTNNGLTYLAESTGSTATMTLSGNSQYVINNNILVARFGTAQAVLTLTGTSSVTKSAGYCSIGNEGTAVMNVQNSASFNAPNNDFNIGDVGASTGTLNLMDSGTVSVVNAYIGKNINTHGTLNQTGGVFLSGTFISIGRYQGGTGTVNASAGTLTATTTLTVGEAGTGTLNISGSAIVTVNGAATYVAGTNTGNGTLNLNGGTLITKQVIDAGGNSLVNFNGGILKAAAGANPAFLSGLDSVNILSGGAVIDTNGQSLAVAQNLSGSGGLTKSGAGVLTLSGTNTYTGPTTVNGGTLSVSSAYFANAATITIASGAVLNLTHGLTDQVGGLKIGNITLPVGIYDATTHPGVITGSGKLQVIITASAYDTWIAGFPSIAPADRGPAADPDHDGSLNMVEFALGGAPDSGSSRPGIYTILADSNGDTLKELLMTIAVRSGTPAFTGSPSPSASQDGVTYTIEGSTTLGSFTGTVTPVSLVAPPAPNAAPPGGYEYRTFSLGGSNGLPAGGFLRVKITQ